MGLLNGRRDRGPKPSNPSLVNLGPILVIALPADPQPSTKHCGRFLTGLHRGEHRRVLISIVTSFAPIEEHSPIRRLGVTNVLSATCYRCPVTRHLLLRVPRQTKGCLVKGADALQHVGNTANHHLGPVASGCLLEVGGHRAAPVRMIKEVRQSLL